MLCTCKARVPFKICARLFPCVLKNSASFQTTRIFGLRRRGIPSGLTFGPRDHVTAGVVFVEPFSPHRKASLIVLEHPCMIKSSNSGASVCYLHLRCPSQSYAFRGVTTTVARASLAVSAVRSGTYFWRCKLLACRR